MALASQPNAIAELRRFIERAGVHGAGERKVLPFGVAEFDEQLPGDGLPQHGSEPARASGGLSA
jgi:hypothetical protein